MWRSATESRSKQCSAAGICGVTNRRCLYEREWTTTDKKKRNGYLGTSHGRTRQISHLVVLYWHEMGREVWSVRLRMGRVCGRIVAGLFAAKDWLCFQAQSLPDMRYRSEYFSLPGQCHSTVSDVHFSHTSQALCSRSS